MFIKSIVLIEVAGAVLPPPKTPLVLLPATCLDWIVPTVLSPKSFDPPPLEIVIYSNVLAYVEAGVNVT